MLLLLADEQNHFRDVFNQIFSELLIQYSKNDRGIWPQKNVDALRSIMFNNDSDFELYLEKGCRIVTSEASGIEPFLLYATKHIYGSKNYGWCCTRN